MAQQVHIEGIDEVLASLAKHIETMQSGSVEAVKTISDEVVKQAQDLAPVETGRLRDSIRIVESKQGEKPEALVSATVDYAPHVEFGTSNMSAEPFLRPALHRVGSGWPANAATIIKRGNEGG